MDVLAGAWKGASNLELEAYLKIPTIESDLEIPPQDFHSASYCSNPELVS